MFNRGNWEKYLLICHFINHSSRLGLKLRLHNWKPMSAWAVALSLLCADISITVLQTFVCVTFSSWCNHHSAPGWYIFFKLKFWDKIFISFKQSPQVAHMASLFNLHEVRITLLHLNVHSSVGWASHLYYWLELRLSAPKEAFKSLHIKICGLGVVHDFVLWLLHLFVKFIYLKGDIIIL